MAVRSAQTRQPVAGGFDVAADVDSPRGILERRANAKVRVRRVGPASATSRACAIRRLSHPRASEESSVACVLADMILVTNDDGVSTHPGCSALARPSSASTRCASIAPNRNWTAAGHTKTLDRPLRVTEIKLPGTRLAAFSSDGSPSDCVALGFLGLAPERPRLVVSGINTGPNMGSDITYSGTVSAAMEGVVSGVPAIAVSLADYFEWDFAYAGELRRATGADGSCAKGSKATCCSTSTCRAAGARTSKACRSRGSAAASTTTS